MSESCDNQSTTSAWTGLDCSRVWALGAVEQAQSISWLDGIKGTALVSLLY